MTKREVVRTVLEGKKPPYVPWSYKFTREPEEILKKHFGTPEDVRRESRRLLDLGADGGYIFSPSHAVESDTPLENILAFINEAFRQGQPEPFRCTHHVPHER